MAGAIIVIDQPGGAGAGTPGVARKDLWQTKQVNLSCATGGNSSFQWDLLDIPPGSGASLVGQTTSTPNFIPDLIGTYRIQLITNGGGPGNVMILVVRVRFGATGVMQNSGWSPPAYGEQSGESNYDGNTRGWAEEIEYIFADISSRLGDLEPLEFIPVPVLADTNKVLKATGAGTAIWDVAGAENISWDAGTSTLKVGDDNDVTLNKIGATSAIYMGVPSATDGNYKIKVDVTGDTLQLGQNTTTTYINGPLRAQGSLNVFDSMVVVAGDGLRITGNYVVLFPRVAHVNADNTLNKPLPTQICGVGVDRGNVAGVSRDSHGLYWDEAAGYWKAAVNTSGDDSTLGAYLPFRCSDFLSNGSKPSLLPQKFQYEGISGIQQTSSTIFDEKGAIVFDPSALFTGNGQITRTITLVAVLECAVGGQTCSLELYNITDGATVTTLTTSNTTPTIVTSAALVVPTNLPNSQKLYGLRLKRTGGTASDFVSCKLARLEVTYA